MKVTLSMFGSQRKRRKGKSGRREGQRWSEEEKEEVEWKDAVEVEQEGEEEAVGGER